MAMRLFVFPMSQRWGEVSRMGFLLGLVAVLGLAQLCATASLAATYAFSVLTTATQAESGCQTALASDDRDIHDRPR